MGYRSLRISFHIAIRLWPYLLELVIPVHVLANPQFRGYTYAAVRDEGFDLSSSPVHAPDRVDGVQMVWKG
jgi:hypothetical protein